MAPIAAYFGDVMQVALAAVAAALMVISINAYRRRSEGRYLILAVAFVSLCVVSVATLVLEFFTGAGPETVQMVEVYVVPSLELLMAMSFLMALLWSPKTKQYLKVAFPVAIIALFFLVSAAYASNSGPTVGIQSAALPSDCARPTGGFLIVASSWGYNDSVAHGAPARNWPVMDVKAGSNVTITICNTYKLPVGFQIVHYLQAKTEVIQPGQALTVSFVVGQKGTFLIYCAIFCPIHIFLQGGELNVA